MDVRRLSPLCLFLLVCGSLASLSAQGPGEKGAVLRTDFDLTPSKPTPPAVGIYPPGTQTPDLGLPGVARAPAAMPDYLRQMLEVDSQPVDPANPNARRGLGGDDVPDINRDLQLTPSAGNWLIMVISYPGDKGAMQARKMCLEIREKNKAGAYVFVFGAEERRQERDRVRKILRDQKLALDGQGLKPFETPKIRHKFVELQHAVLIAGFPDVEGANRGLQTVKKWPQPDEKKVELEVKYYHDSNKKGNEPYYVYVNPFQRAFACRNPTIKAEAPEAPKIDVAALRRLNGDESYSLFKCKKPFTLAVKDFQTPYMMHDHKTSSNVWDVLVGNRGDAKDGAKLSAHNLAEALAKLRVTPVFVLHSKFSSTVTVGEFDGPDDPALKSTQEMLAQRLSRPEFSQIQFFHRPVPMPVPK